MNRLLDVATSIGSSVARFGLGSKVGPLGRRPEQALLLYEFESCPFCRKVREALSLLDLEADVRPCPKRGERYRPGVVERGGKAQFPYLVDPNTGKEMYESDEINRYLFAEYGRGPVPFVLSAGPVGLASAMAASAVRPGAGTFVQSSRPPEQPLTLYSYEASPFCRIVRERLCTLEIPYRLVNVAKGSPSRDAFVELSGQMQVPYLIDPNTDVAMFESADIVRYLESTYGA